jgi:hypothetical protein
VCPGADWRARVLPEFRLTPFTVLRFLLATILVSLAAVASTDTDIWGHVQFGLELLESRRLPTIDPHSFTSTQRWVDHEWLSHFLFGSAFALGEVPLLIALRAVNASALLLVLLRGLRSLPWHIRDPLAAAVVLASIPQLSTVRPQIFTLTAYALILLGLLRRALWLPVVFAVWANIHGGWLFGLASVGVWTLCHLNRRNALLFIACCLATLVNPYGVNLWIALADAAWRGWADVSEWQPVYRLDVAVAPAAIWAIVSAALMWGVLARLTAGRFAWVWTAIAALVAFRSQRLVPLYAVTAAILIGRHVQLRSRPVVETNWTSQALVVILASVCAASLIVYTNLAPIMACLPPVREAVAPESSAVTFIRAANLRGRVMMWFDWGLYAIWHVGDHLNVSIDNRRETVYSNEVVQRHLQFYAGLDPQYVDEIAADYAWLPVNLPPVRQLQDNGWHPLFRGPRSVILGRRFSPIAIGMAHPGEPCFPNP